MARARLAFLDLSRCAAIVLMVFAHVRDELLSPTDNGHWLMVLHDVTRGFTAPIFFTVSGWAFAAATLATAERYTTWSPWLRARLVRIGTLFLLGYLLTMPWWHSGFPFDVPRKFVVPFATFGVLQCIAAAILVLHVVLYVTKSVRAVLATAAGLTLLAVGAGTWLQAEAAHWPLFLRGAFNTDGHSGGFPMAPFAAYFWAGAFMGGLTLRRALNPAVTAAVASVLCFAFFTLVWPLLKGEPTPYHFIGSPGLFLKRSAAAFGFIALLAVVSRGLRLPPAVELTARRALTFYVGHMVALWGVPKLRGLVSRFGHQLDAGQVVLTAALLLAALFVFSYGLEYGPARWRAFRAGRTAPVPAGET